MSLINNMRFLYIIPLIIVLITSGLLYKNLLSGQILETNFSKLDQEVELFSIPLIGKTSNNLDNKILETDDLIILKFFSSWCSKCIEEHSFLNQLAERPNIKIYGIIVRDNEQNILNMIHKLGNPYEKIASDQEGRVAISFGVRSIPTSIIIKNQKIVSKISSPITEKIYQKIIKQFQD